MSRTGSVPASTETDREPLLPPAACRLLSVMFRRSSVCQRSEANLAAEAGVRTVRRLLHILTEAGFLSKEPAPPRIPNTYRLHLPPAGEP